MARMKNKAVRKMERPEAETRLGELAALTVERDQKLAELDAEIVRIRQERESEIQLLESRINTAFADLQAWAETHPEEFKDRRSIEMVHGTLGFRTGNPTLKCLKGVTWEKVLERLNDQGLVAYIRTKHEPDKEKLLADRTEAVGQLFPKIGLQVGQANTFFVEPKRETLPDGTMDAVMAF